MAGLLIEFEGLDCSFKETNSTLLTEYLSKETFRPCARIEYPRYLSGSSFFIKQYLAGKYGEDPAEVSPEIGMMIYALDRYHDWMTNIKNLYDQGYILVADRYTMSNMIYQAAKVDPIHRVKYINKVYELEHKVLKLPKPNICIFMDQPIEVAQYLMEEKNAENDIHEHNNPYMNQVYRTFYTVSDMVQRKQIYPKSSSTVIKCGENGLPRGKKEIFKDIKDFIDKHYVLFE